MLNLLDARLTGAYNDCVSLEISDAGYFFVIRVNGGKIKFSVENEYFLVFRT